MARNRVSLGTGHATALKAATGRDADAALPTDLRTDVEEEVEILDAPQSGDSEARSRLKVFRKQAQLLVKGNQDTNEDLPYLVDSLREAAGMKRTWGTAALPEDDERVRRIMAALALAKSGNRHRCEFNSDPDAFRRDLHEHASGFLAPLIKELHVRWNSSLLRTGMVLVDLPGVGVAGDAYKQATRKWINEKVQSCSVGRRSMQASQNRLPTCCAPASSSLACCFRPTSAPTIQWCLLWRWPVWTMSPKMSG